MAEKMATRAAYGKALVEIGAENPNLVVMDADLSKSTMTAEFSKTYPERFFNMGIAEQNLYGTAAGLALSGKVVCASTFAMFAAGRAFEIIRNSIGYTGANVKVCATHAGITVGEDGASHQTFEDLALMRTIPGMTVVNPSDGVSAKLLLKQVIGFDGLPTSDWEERQFPYSMTKQRRFDWARGISSARERTLRLSRPALWLPKPWKPLLRWKQRALTCA